MEITSYLGSISKRFLSFLTALYPPSSSSRPSAVEIVITITEHGHIILRIFYYIPYTP